MVSVFHLIQAERQLKLRWVVVAFKCILHRVGKPEGGVPQLNDTFLRCFSAHAKKLNLL
jgi:hypothetical protein